MYACVFDLGVFFLLAQGRLSLCRSQPARAIASYQKAMSVQSQYRNLHHVSFWEMAVSNLALWRIEESLKCWRNLHKESTVRVPCLCFVGNCIIGLSLNIVVEGGLRLWRRGASCAAGQRGELGRRSKVNDTGP